MTQMNARLEIASRLMAALVAEFATGKLEPWKELWDELRGDALREADALIAEEARTRPPAAKEPFHPRKADSGTIRVTLTQQEKSLPDPVDSPWAADAPAPDDLRAVAEELAKVVELYASLHAPGVVDCEFIQIHKERGWNGVEDRTDFRNNLANAALARARAMGLGGGK